ncbi:MAG TPA: DUF2282 domain-containing protein [Acetobacteraceae bacterium]|nr:DUF2282 domain-containing protein [Acetobacteraceae bacterium]
MNTSTLLAAAILAAAATPTLARAAASGPAPVPSYPNEKCYGIAAIHANDCSTAHHTCAGQSSVQQDPGSWLYVPAGTCMKIYGGSLTAKS